MKEICKLAAEKGFKAKALSTDWTLKDYNGKNSGFKINDTCDYLLLCEIQKFIREKLNIDIFIINAYVQGNYNKYTYVARFIGGEDVNTKDFNSDTYEEALEAGIKEILENYDIIQRS